LLDRTPDRLDIGNVATPLRPCPLGYYIPLATDFEEPKVSHPFLSDAWFDAVGEIRAKYEGQIPEPPAKIKMNQLVTESPFGEDGITKIFIDTTGGEMVMERGEVEGADVTMTVDYATAKAIIVDQDQAAAMQAFMTGKIKVTGDMMKLMAMNAAPPTDIAQQVAADIKAITAS
jgi:putative sterol carrier protein